MKIAIDISQIVYEGSGVAMYTRNLVENLLRIDKKNDYLLFGTSLRKKRLLDRFAADLRSQGLKFQTVFLLLPQTFTTELWNDIHHVRIERLVGKIDLFHSSDWVEPPSRVRKVTTIHDLVVYRNPESSHPRIIEEQKKRLKWVKKESSGIMVDSLATKRDCEKILGIPAREMAVVPLAAGPDYQQFAALTPRAKKESLAAVAKKYHLSKPYFLAVGTREPRKNQARLKSAFTGLEEKGYDLVLAGKPGWGEAGDINEKVPGIQALGFVPQGDLPGLYAGAAAFVYPSLYEGFGIPVLEAMTVGTPVITSKNSSLPEAGGAAAIYVNPVSETDIRLKLRQIINLSDKERDNLIRKGLRQAEKFSWQKTAQSTLKFYESVVK